MAAVVLWHFVLLFSPNFIFVDSHEHGMCNITLNKGCDELLPGQYRCDETLKVDTDTQSIVGCKDTHTVEGNKNSDSMAKGNEESVLYCHIDFKKVMHMSKTCINNQISQSLYKTII